MPDIGRAAGGSLATNAYKINDIDDSDATYTYYGFTTADGEWYIVREHRANQEFRYVRGASLYTTAWTNRATQTYDYYDNVF